MITKVTLNNFKRYTNKTIELKPHVTLLVGGNNEGKSTLLHALAIWEFCKVYIKGTKGIAGLKSGTKITGVGLNINDFTPINIPELKYLWTNLKPSSGYNLKIKCYWIHNGVEKYLEFGLALANDRLFIKTTDSNILDDTRIPNIVYIPPFAGITNKEVWHLPAQRKRLIGQGISGAVLRNVIIDMYNINLEVRRELKLGKTKISNKDLKQLRANDPYELLNATLAKTFKCQLYPKIFNPEFHQNITVELKKGDYNGVKFVPYKNYHSRDIMVEGSGFLQWLSVYTYALNNDIDILLLDEPDAHLHSSLQMLLFNQLKHIAHLKNKQILIATHSVEIIQNADALIIMDINKGHCKYISATKQKTAILAGIGTEYSPILHKIQQTKRVLFVENGADEDILKRFARISKKEWPENITVWPMANKWKERNNIIEALRLEVPDVMAISLNDKDSNSYNDIKADLSIGTYADKKSGTDTYARFRVWRRSEIENYLLHKDVMKRVTGKTDMEINDFFTSQGIVYPGNDKFIQSDMEAINKPIFELSGKEIVHDFIKKHSIKVTDLIDAYNVAEIPNDIITIIDEIIDMRS